MFTHAFVVMMNGVLFTPVPLEISGYRFELVFTLRSLAAMQQRYGYPVLFPDGQSSYTDVLWMLALLINGTSPGAVTEKWLDEQMAVEGVLLDSVSAAALAWNASLPHGDSPDTDDGPQPIDFDMWLYRGITLLGIPEREVWAMPLCKLDALFREHCRWNGVPLEQARTLDDVLPP